MKLLDWWLIKVQVEAPNHFKFGVGGKAFDGYYFTLVYITFIQMCVNMCISKILVFADNVPLVF